MTLNIDRSDIRGWGSDSDPKNRPGVPFETSPLAPAGNAHWTEPEPQVSEAPAATSPDRRITPVFSTRNPPRGLSGAMRRAAYQVPPYKARRWLMLLMADRIDVLEHNAKPLAKLAAGAALLYLGFRAARALRGA